MFIVIKPSILLTASLLTGKRKESNCILSIRQKADKKNMEKGTELDVKVFAQYKLSHFHSYGSSFTLKVRFALLLNSLLDFAYDNAIVVAKAPLL